MADQHDIGDGRDRVVARALQHQLDERADDVRLLARIRELVRITRPETGFDVLAGWARPGLAAAAAVILCTLFWHTFLDRPAPIEAALSPMPSAESLLSAAIGTEPR